MVFVALAFDGPGFLGKIFVFLVTAGEWPVLIGAVGLFEDLFRFGDQLGFVFGEVFGFARVFGEVVDFDGFVDFVADGFPVTPAGGLSGSTAFVEFPVEVVPLGGLATFEVGEEGVAVGFKSGGRFGAAHFDEGGEEIPKGPGLGIDASGGDSAGPPGEGGLAEGTFIHAALESFEAVGVLFEELADFGFGTEGGSVVAGEDDEGVFVDALGAESVDEFADVGIDAGDLGGVGFLFIGPRLVGVDAEVIDFVRSMRKGDGVEKHEGVFGVLLHPLDHFVLDEFLGVGLANTTTFVAGEGDGVVVVVEVGGEVGMGMTLAVVAEETVDALLVRAAGGVEKSHAPLAEGGGGIVGGFGDFANGDGFGRNGELTFGREFVVAADRAVTGVESGEKGRATGSANAGATVGLGVACSFGAEFVEAGSLDEFLAVDPDVTLGNVIAEDEDEVWFAICGGEKPKTEKKKDRDVTEHELRLFE